MRSALHRARRSVVPRAILDRLRRPASRASAGRCSARRAGSILAAVWLLAAFPAVADDPWTVLEDFRRALEAQAPLSAGFVQTHVPYGFDPEDGDTERGDLAIDLPGCLRWDYSPPFETAFLLCDRTVHHWNPGEPVGQRYDLSEQPAPGLDFFLLATDDLRDRYEAEQDRESGDDLRLVLRPLEPTEDVALVRIVIDRNRQRLRELTYYDAQRNENRFIIGDYRSGADPGSFEPPPGIEWEEP